MTGSCHGSLQYAEVWHDTAFDRCGSIICQKFKRVVGILDNIQRQAAFPAIFLDQGSLGPRVARAVKYDAGLRCKVKRLGQRCVVDISTGYAMLLRVGGSGGRADTFG